jgi:drug/metabolite transporter (DMT)-like permease
MAESYGSRMRTTLLLVVVIVSGVVYHLAQKGSRGDSPWLILTIAYSAALAMTVSLAVATGEAKKWTFSFAQGASGLLIGVAALGIEAGYFFLYRSGWKLASASVIAGAIGTTVLALLGMTIFRESMTVPRALGIALATGGAALLARG